MLSQGSRQASGEGTLRNRLLSFAVGFLTVIALAACQSNFTTGVELNENVAGIVNGNDADGSEPFVKSIAGLAVQAPTGQLAIFCTGTIISEDLVVTAGHCIPNVQNDRIKFFVVFGLNESSENLELRPIVRKTAHDNYPSKGSNQDINDIGLVQFSGGLPEGYHPMPILEDDSVLQPGTEVLMVGYGTNNPSTQGGSGILRYTYIPIAGSFGENEIVTDESKSGSCNGDSGGPGLIYLDGQYYLWGATSRGDAYCRRFGIYTKVTAYRDWITQKQFDWSFPPAEQPTDAVAVGAR